MKNKKVENISIETADLFFNLWKNLDNKQFSNSIQLILDRFKINNFSKNNFKGKTVLDVGCGSGRYCVLASSLNAKKVIGIDSSKKNVNFNNQKFKNVPKLKFIFGDNTNLKIQNNFSDITISNGVIHHTSNMYKSLDELIRVTKKGGKILLMVYGSYGLRWNLIKRLRPICKILGKNSIIKALKKNDFPANKIKHFIDDLFVPIQYQLSLSNIKQILKSRAKVKVWNKTNTLDHEQNITTYINELFLIKKIFLKIENKVYKSIVLKMINNSLNEIKFIKNSNLSRFKKRYLIIGEGNHRLELVKK